MEKRKPYFDPYVLQRVLEHTHIPPIGKEILKPWSVGYRHTFLYPSAKVMLKEQLEQKMELINGVVNDEMFYQLSSLLDYIEPSEEDKQLWFDELREQFNLPLDYEFE